MKKILQGLFIILLVIGCARTISDLVLKVGDGTDNDVRIEAELGKGASNPSLKYNSTDNKWQACNEGEECKAIGYNIIYSDSFGVNDFAAGYTTQSLLLPVVLSVIPGSMVEVRITLSINLFPAFGLVNSLCDGIRMNNYISTTNLSSGQFVYGKNRIDKYIGFQAYIDSCSNSFDTCCRAFYSDDGEVTGIYVDNDNDGSISFNLNLYSSTVNDTSSASLKSSLSSDLYGSILVKQL